MTGGWLFGYAEALNRAGLDTVIICLSSSIAETRRMTRDSAVSLVAMPQLAMHRRLRAHIGDEAGRSWVGSPVKRCLTAGVQLLATPPASIERILAQEHCHALLVQEYEYTRFDRLVRLAHRCHLPCFATFQGADFTASPLEAMFRHRSIDLATGFVIAGETERARLSQAYGVPRNKIAPIPNPLDLGVWYPMDRVAAREAVGLSPGDRIVICHGRIDMHRKGLDILLNAWAQVEKPVTDPPAHLILIGDGQDRAALGDRLSQSDLTNVRWIDRYVTDRPEMRQWLSASDLYVSASRIEGMPVAPLEAMACGLPVVASAAHGIIDILPDGEASGGLVVDVGDQDALAAALIDVIGSEDRRGRMAARALDRVRTHFSIDSVAQQLGALFRDHIKGS